MFCLPLFLVVKEVLNLVSFFVISTFCISLISKFIIFLSKIIMFWDFISEFVFMLTVPLNGFIIDLSSFSVAA